MSFLMHQGRARLTPIRKGVCARMLRYMSPSADDMLLINLGPHLCATVRGTDRRGGERADHVVRA